MDQQQLTIEIQKTKDMIDAQKENEKEVEQRIKLHQKVLAELKLQQASEQQKAGLNSIDDSMDTLKESAKNTYGEKINLETQTLQNEVRGNHTTTTETAGGLGTTKTTEGVVDKPEEEQTKTEKKNIFEKGWESVKEYNEEIKKDRENGEKGKAIGKVALEATGLALVGWLGNKMYKGVKNLFGGKSETANSGSETTKTSNDGNQDIIINNINGKKKNRLQRNFGRILGGAGAAGAAYYFRDKLYQIPLIGPWLDDLVNDKLTIEEAIHSVEGNMLANANEDHLKQDVRLSRDESTNILSAFGEKFKIDPKKRMIEGLATKFKNFEDLISACMMIGSAKYHFRGKCDSSSPFSISPLGGDIEISLSNDGVQDFASGSGFPVGTTTGGIVGTTLGSLLGFYAGRSVVTTAAGAVAGGTGMAIAGRQLLDQNDTFSKVCPTLNNDEEKHRFQSYLNSLGGWEAGKDTEKYKRANSSDPIINDIFLKTFDDIEAVENEYNSESSDQGRSRHVSINDYPQHQNIYTLTTRRKPCYIHVERDNSNGIKSATVEDTNIVFTGANAFEQALHLGSFINLCEKTYVGKGARGNKSFDYGISANGLISYDFRDLVGLLPEDMKNKPVKGILFYNKDNTAGGRLASMSYSRESLKKNIPTLLEGDNMETFISRLNSRKSNGKPIRSDEKSKGRYNTFLESLQSNQSTDPLAPPKVA